MRKELLIRVCADLGILFVATTLPWWVSLVLSCLAFFRFKKFFEFVFFGFYLDILYGVPILRLGGFDLVFSLIYLFVFSAILFFSRVVRE
ncbi:MAG: hypothetical protein WC797_02495 [Candidatus Paceibacterota bacterium]|jgi:hypothetical protein